MHCRVDDYWAGGPSGALRQLHEVAPPPKFGQTSDVCVKLRPVSKNDLLGAGREAPPGAYLGL